MSLITIRQTGAWGDSPNATASFDRQGEFPVTLAAPFSPQEETDLEWYFEEHLKFPFTHQVRASTAAESVTRYGEALFAQVFKRDFAIYEEYQKAKQPGVDTLNFEIISAPEFHRLHWEALKDPELPEPFVVHAPMVRSTSKPPRNKFAVQPAPTINLLVITARPRGKSDVGYRTISRPLVEGLRAAQIPVWIEILRPGTYPALVEHLTAIRDRHGVGYYHIIHFDLHGALLTHAQLQNSAPADGYTFQNRFGRKAIAPYAGQKAFLAFEGEDPDQSDLVEAGELADLLLNHQIPIAILNACQSGKQAGDTETSLGSRLLQAGVQTVLAMGYSVTVSAAALLMQTLYRQLFQQNDLARAIRHARCELFNRKARRVYFNQRLNLEDWLLPVVYQSGPAGARLPLRPFTFEEQAAYYAAQAARYRAPDPTYGFVGRDMDILEIEKRLLRCRAGRRQNLLLLRGMGGAGKTTLLHHLGAWWQTTRFVDQVCYFGYDEKAWTLPQVMDQLAQQLFAHPGCPQDTGCVSCGYASAANTRCSDEQPGFAFQLMQFRAMPLKAQQQMLAQKLRSERHLLILDNLESITGAHLAIRNTLPPAERAALAGFLADLRDGQTLVLLGSRGGEEWLAHGPNAPLAADAVYDLPGLDPEAASTLAERILERHVTDVKTRNAYRESAEFRRLLKLLDGYPLPLEIVLANLRRQPPQEILAALQAGAVDLDAKDAASKTESILTCIDYSHSNLSPDAQTLLLCLAPFTGVINLNPLENYTKYLRQQPALAGLPFDRWPEVLQEAANWGLLTPHEIPGFLHLQPIFPYFLRTRLASPLLGGAGGGFLSPEVAGGGFPSQPTPNPSQEGKPHPQPLPKGEGSRRYPVGEGPGVRLAIETAFRQHYDGIGGMLAGLLKSKEPQERQAGQLLTRLEYENLSTALNLALAAQASIGNLYFSLSRYLDTTQDQQRGLTLGQMVFDRLQNYPAERLAGQLGYEFAGVLNDIAKRQLSLKQYAAAEASYQKALELFKGLIGFEEKQKAQLIASVFHQLGRVAEEQRQWAQAEQYYQQALALYIEFNDRYRQAATYHQLGRVAEKQGQWPQAREYFLKALETYFEFQDEHNLGITLRSLARLWQGSPDAALPAAVAAVLGVTPAEAEEVLNYKDSS